MLHSCWNPILTVVDPQQHHEEPAMTPETSPAQPCPHARVRIDRKHGCWVRHSFFQGQPQTTRTIVGDSNGTILVRCFDCDYERKFTASQEKPPWVLDLLRLME